MSDLELDKMNDEEENEDTQAGKFLTFKVAKEEFGIEIRYVLDINGMQGITVLPDVPDYIKGVINLRGKVTPVLDVRLRFGLKERPYDERTCIIVVHLNDVSVGLIVDRVSEVLDIPDSEIEPPPKIRKGSGSRFIQGLGKVDDSVKILLDVHKLLFDEDADKAEETVQAD